MFRTFVNAWKVADIRKKIIFTAIIILIYRIGSSLPVPFVDMAQIAAKEGIFGTDTASTFVTYLSMMTGNAFNYGTLFALSITPYINASIIIQLLTVVIPYLQNLSKEGEEGRKKMDRINRYTAVVLGLLQSVAYFFYIRSQEYLTFGKDSGKPSQVLQALVIILCYTAGTVIVMWLGERINEKGIGNGVSIILFAGIVARMPTTITQLYEYMDHGGPYFVLVPVAAVALIAMIFYIVWMDNAERRIPVQYAKRVVGRKMYGGQNSHMPIKVNMCGVLPIIFAGSILSIIPTIAMFAPGDEGTFWYKLSQVWLGQTHPVYGTLYFIFIIFFAYFYAAIQYNPIDMADNLRKNSGSVPGIRPGKPTSTYIAKILNRITLLGALLLSVVAMFPIIYSQVAGIFTDGMNLAIGGTSIIILVGVALETEKQIESQMMMRHYKGFLE